MMRTGMVSLLVYCATVCVAAAGGLMPVIVTAPHAPDTGSLDVRCGRLIDGLQDAVRSDQLIRIEAGRVREVRDFDRVGDKPALDLSDYTCLPGLIDMHTHLTDQAGDSYDLSVYFRRSDAESRNIARRNAELTLLAGFTTARNVGAYVGWSGRELRERINRGEIIGPRLQIAGYYLTVPGGGGDLIVPGKSVQDIPARVRMGVASGVDEFRAKATEAVAGGADFLKVIASGAVLAYGGIPGSPEMTQAEIAAVVDVAHAAGLKVAAHAHGAQSIKDAIRAGADTIEHASLADAEAIAMAVEARVAFSMDIYNADYISSAGRAQGWPEEFLGKNEETAEAQRQVFTRAYRAGVPIVYGTDSAVYPHGDNARQFEVMLSRGMTAMDAIRSATALAAQYMGWGEEVGAIEAGRYGDLIAVRGDPLEDIGSLQRIDVVLKGGLVFKLPKG